MSYFNNLKNFYLVGIGGSGMNGIAEILVNMGCNVSGSDIKDSDIIEHLKSLGIKINIGHDADNITSDIDVVIYSSAVKIKDNVELKEAKNKRIPTIKRAVMLAELSRTKMSIAVAGTHGKTTTSSMLGRIFTIAGLDPTIIVGGIIQNTKTGARWGNSDYIIIEADEYDQSFLKLSPIFEVITNIESDHLECYGSYENIKDAFVRFINRVPFYGKSALCLDEEGIQNILPRIESPYVTYSLKMDNADYYAKDVKINKNGVSFYVYYRGKKLGKIETHLFGEHNIKNSLGAISIAHDIGVEFDVIANAFSDFVNAKRRFETIGVTKSNIRFIDDYAHHPTEIKATLQAAKAIADGKGKVIALFQPHLFSRTINYADEFGKAFDEADILLVTDIYPAREVPIEGVTSLIIVNRILKHNEKQNLKYIRDLSDLSKYVISSVESNDVVISLGAGSINKYLYEIFEEIND